MIYYDVSPCNGAEEISTIYNKPPKDISEFIWSKSKVNGFDIEVGRHKNDCDVCYVRSTAPSKRIQGCII